MIAVWPARVNTLLELGWSDGISGVASVYGTRDEFSRLAPPPLPPPVKTGGPPPVCKNIFYGLAEDCQEYSFAKIDLHII